jgi:hypothetical protein
MRRCGHGLNGWDPDAPKFIVVCHSKRIADVAVSVAVVAC